jgi:thiamine pyrophosphokinase
MKIVIFANGPMDKTTPTTAVLADCDLIIAADGGARHCRALDITPDLLLGDMDSVAPADLEVMLAGGTRIKRYPSRKNRTDLDLALSVALDHHPKEVIIFGGLGGRWDMSLANLMLLADPALASISLAFLDGTTKATLLRGRQQYTVLGAAGDTVSLIPISTSIEGLTLTGFEYPLSNHRLSRGTTLAISNQLNHHRGLVCLERGLLFLIVTGQPPQND